MHIGKRQLAVSTFAAKPIRLYSFFFFFPSTSSLVQHSVAASATTAAWHHQPLLHSEEKYREGATGGSGAEQGMYANLHSLFNCTPGQLEPKSSPTAWGRSGRIGLSKCAASHGSSVRNCWRVFACSQQSIQATGIECVIPSKVTLNDARPERLNWSALRRRPQGNPQLFRVCL